MEIVTTQPACSSTPAIFLDGTIKAKRVVYKKHAGFCMETQHFPDSVNHPEFPCCILKPGEMYSEMTSYNFSAK